MKKINFKILLILIAFISQSQRTLAAEAGDLDVSVTSKTRARFEESKEVVQQKFRLVFGYSIDGEWEIRGMARTGEKYNSNYNTLYDIESTDFDYDPNFDLAQLYLRNKGLLGKGSLVEAGSIPTEKGNKSVTALDSGGWIEGARIRVQTEHGELTVVGGSLTEDAKEVSIFGRERDLNYMEIRFNQDFLDALGAEKISTEIGGQLYDDDSYFNEAIRAKFKFLGGRILTVVQEALIMEENSAIKLSEGVEFDLMNLLTGIADRPSGIKVAIRHEYMSDDMGTLGTRSSGFYGKSGHHGILEAKKSWKVGKRSKVTLGGRIREGSEHRREVFMEFKHSF